MARSFNEKMEKKRQAEYNRWKAECNPVWHRRNHWLPKYEEEGTSVWNMATTASGGVTHYAKFPNELAERCILCGTAEGDVVLDPFVGSGTSCRVANRYGRQYIGD